MARPSGAFRERSPEVERLFEEYEKLLAQYAIPLGLCGFAPEELPTEIRRSALVADEVLSGAGSVLDVGTGAGLPGIPMAIVRSLGGRRDPRVSLVEPKKKAVAFLEKVERELNVGVRIVNASAGQAAEGTYESKGKPLRAEVVVARALAKPPAALELCAPLCAAGGRILLVTSSEVRPEEFKSAQLAGLSGPLRIVLGKPGKLHQPVLQWIRSAKRDFPGEFK